jgi:hypothetical protein
MHPSSRGKLLERAERFEGSQADIMSACVLAHQTFRV